MYNFKDLTGKIYGKLVVLSRAENKGNATRWLCRCECGKEVLVHAGSLTSNHTKSCGCLRKTAPEKRDGYHGLSKTKEHKSWVMMNERCFSENRESYKTYGAVGITSEYKDDFLKFLEEIGPMPQDGLRYSVDRIDNNKGYVKGNIRWATSEQQTRNRGKMKHNTSGKTGVTWRICKNNGKQYLYATATWADIDYTRRSKSFSVRELGLLEAFAAACAYRDKMIAELNEQGAGYSPNHGK